MNQVGGGMREYHIDSYLFTTNIKPEVSVPLTTRRLLIVDQDESVFKQNSFSQQYWSGPGGETKLLPKNDGCRRMVSGFVSHTFGFGL